MGSQAMLDVRMSLLQDMEGQKKVLQAKLNELELLLQRYMHMQMHCVHRRNVMS